LTPEGRLHLAKAEQDVLPTRRDRTPAPTVDAFEARSRSLYALCVRFAAAVARVHATLDSAAVASLSAGRVHLRGFITRFLLRHLYLPPCPGLPGAHHLHLIVEADDRGALTSGLRGLLVRAESDLAAGKCDLIAVGRPILANPDLVARWKSGAALNAPDFSTFYLPGPKGYTDYPALA